MAATVSLENILLTVDNDGKATPSCLAAACQNACAREKLPKLAIAFVIRYFTRSGATVFLVLALYGNACTGVVHVSVIGRQSRFTCPLVVFILPVLLCLAFYFGPVSDPPTTAPTTNARNAWQRQVI